MRLTAAYDDMTAGRYAAAHAAFAALAAGGELLGHTYLGWMYERGLGVAVDENRARDLYRLACDGGEPIACYYGASLKYRRGDAAGALEMFVRAADVGHASAAYWAYVICRGGRGFPADPVRASEYLRLAASRGHVFAQRDWAKLQIRAQSSLLAKASALLQYARALVKGVAIAMRNADDSRVR